MLTRALVAINVIVFLWERLTDALGSDDQLLAHGALLGTRVLAGDWWRIGTAAFMHGGEMHLIFNMIALWQVGSFVEEIFGTPRMALIYLAALVGGGLAVTLRTPEYITVGASGAIFGLFGALVVAGMGLGPAGRRLVQQSLGIIVINLIIGFTLPNISNDDHIGGLVCGFLSALVLFRKPPPVPVEVPYARPVVNLASDPGVITIDQPPDPPPERHP